MALPQAVQQLADQADEIENGLKGEPQEAPVQSDQQTEEPTKETIAGGEQQDYSKLEARLKTLQGMYSADTQRLKAKIESQSKEADDLRAQITELKKARHEPLISEEDKDAFGPDMYDFVTRAAKDAAREVSGNGANEDVVAEVRRLKEELAQARQERAEQRQRAFFSQMDEALPDWRKQNDNPEFLSWLAEADPFTNIRRQEILDRAVTAGDAHTVAGIFQRFRSESGQTKQESPLAKQIAPARNRSTPSVSPEEKKTVWSQNDIKAFYEAYRRGEIGEQEAMRMEQEIDQAVAEGRVIG